MTMDELAAEVHRKNCTEGMHDDACTAISNLRESLAAAYVECASLSARLDTAWEQRDLALVENERLQLIHGAYSTEAYQIWREQNEWQQQKLRAQDAANAELRAELLAAEASLLASETQLAESQERHQSWADIAKDWKDRAAELVEAVGALSGRFLAERDKNPLKGRRRANPQYDDGYRMGMEDAARIAREVRESKGCLPDDCPLCGGSLGATDGCPSCEQSTAE